MKIQDVINLAKKRGPKTVSVACCQDKEVLLAVENARKEVTRNKFYWEYIKSRILRKLKREKWTLEFIRHKLRMRANE